MGLRFQTGHNPKPFHYYGPDNGELTLAKVNEVRDLGVIGIGIGDSEQAFPPEPFASVYERARELGFKTSAHAGEADGPESVWGAIRSLKVDRIGHGTRATEDTELVEHLVEPQLPVELCPLSNVRTGVSPSIGTHPTKQLLDLGVLVCINTDDPKMFHNTLADEFVQLRTQLGIMRDEVR